MADPTQVQLNQVGFAPEIAPYGQALLGQGAALTDINTNPYMQYQGDRIAQFTPMQQQAFQNASLMQTAPQLQQGTALAGEAGMGALNTGYTYNPSNFTQDSYKQMVNPYLGVMDAAANRNAQIQQNAINSQATTAGAFGGGRQAIMNAQGNADLQRNLAKNQFDAYNQAQQQYNTQAQLNAQQGQFGANLGLQGLNTALNAANTMGTLGNNQYNQNLGVIGLQNQLGGQQQQQVQNDINNKYQDYLSAQNYPYQQLNFMSNLIRGLPMSQQATSVYQAAPSALSQVAGLGLTAAGLGAFKAAKGGAIKESHGLADLALAQMGA